MNVYIAWGLAIGLQTYRAMSQGRAPYPSEFVSSGMWFGGLALADKPTHGVAGIVALGSIAGLIVSAGGVRGFARDGVGGTVGDYITPEGCRTRKDAANGAWGFGGVSDVLDQAAKPKPTSTGGKTQRKVGKRNG